MVLVMIGDVKGDVDCDVNVDDKCDVDDPDNDYSGGRFDVESKVDADDDNSTYDDADDDNYDGGHAANTSYTESSVSVKQSLFPSFSLHNVAVHALIRRFTRSLRA